MALNVAAWLSLARKTYRYVQIPEIHNCDQFELGIWWFPGSQLLIHCVLNQFNPTPKENMIDTEHKLHLKPDFYAVQVQQSSSIPFKILATGQWILHLFCVTDELALWMLQRIRVSSKAFKVDKVTLFFPTNCKKSGHFKDWLGG